MCRERDKMISGPETEKKSQLLNPENCLHLWSSQGTGNKHNMFGQLLLPNLFYIYVRVVVIGPGNNFCLSDQSMKWRLFLVLKSLLQILHHKVSASPVLRSWRSASIPSPLPPVEIQYVWSSADLFPIFCKIIIKRFCSIVQDSLEHFHTSPS